MPRLKQKENGDYYIRAYSHAKDGIDTWQVRDLGLTYLKRKGVHAGKTFPRWQLQEMIESNWAYIGGPGIRSGNAANQNRPVMATPASAKYSPSMKNSLQIIRTKGSQKSKSRVQKAISQSLPVVRTTTSLVFRKYKKRWELLIVFPQLRLGMSQRILASGCSLTVDGARGTLKAKQLQNDNAFLAVEPQTISYGIKLICTYSSRTDLGSLFMELKNSSILEVKGLNLSGTVFERHKEGSLLNEGIRLADNKAMIMSKVYYVVFHKASVPESVPHTIKFKSLGDVGIWEAWEIQLPLKADVAVRDWVTRLGHTLN